MYLNIPQGRTCRYSSKIKLENIIGFYTDNFSSCNILMLSSKCKQDTRISMTHIDYIYDLSNIKSEIEWIIHNGNSKWKYDPNASFAIYMHRKDGIDARNLAIKIATEISKIIKTSIKDLQQRDQFFEFVLEENDFGYAIEFMSLSNKTFSKTNIPPLSCHSSEWQIQAYYILNTYLDRKTKQEYTQILFNCFSWIKDLSKHDLQFTQQVDTTIKQFNIKKIDTWHDVTTKIGKFFPNDVQRTATFSLCYLQLIHKNNLQNILVNSLPDYGITDIQIIRGIIDSFIKTQDFDIFVERHNFEKYITKSKKLVSFGKSKLAKYLIGMFKVFYMAKQHSNPNFGAINLYKGTNQNLMFTNTVEPNNKDNDDDTNTDLYNKFT